MSRTAKLTLLAAFALTAVCHQISAQETETYVPEEKLTLWYTQPADREHWDLYSLPIGNGELGASIFGGVDVDEIIFNEKTLWRGTSKDNA